MNSKADVFGKLVIEKLRDVSIELSEGLVESRYESPGHKEMQDKIKAFDLDQKKVFVECLAYCIDGGINDFLFNLDKSLRDPKGIDVFVDSINLGELTESLSQEVHGESGWKSKFSKYSGQYT